jgi:uncharacterized membrane protein YidH (DUF202 family)
LTFGVLLTVFSLIVGFTRPSFEDVPSLENFSDVMWLLSFAVFLPVGAVVAARHPGNPVGWLFIALGMSEVLSVAFQEYAVVSLLWHPGSLPGGEGASWLTSWVWVPGLSLFPFLVLLFPTGHLPSPRWRWLAWVAALNTVLVTAAGISLWPFRGPRLLRSPELLEEAGLATQVVTVVFPIVLASLVASLASVIVRFRRSRGEERQQLKWIALAAAIGAFGIVLSELFDDMLGIDGTPFEAAIEGLGGPWLIAVAAGVAILRYRLYDIDLIINRTLVYGSLTAILAAAYFGVVVVLQNAIPGADDSDFTIAGSTLAVAALFRPLRSRVQGFIDRRFYRRKVDAQRTLESFSSRLREDVDLDHLSADLLNVVRDTMQPVHASLWLRLPAGGPR